MKKLFSILLATALVLSLCVTSFAAPVVKYIFTDNENEYTYFFCSNGSQTNDSDLGIYLSTEYETVVPPFLYSASSIAESLRYLSVQDSENGTYVNRENWYNSDPFINATARPFVIGLKTNTDKYMLQGYSKYKSSGNTSQTYGTFVFDAETMTDNYQVVYGTNNIYLPKNNPVEDYDTIAERPFASYDTTTYSVLNPYTGTSSLGQIAIFNGGPISNSKNYVDTMALVKVTMPEDADKGVAYMHFKGSKGGNYGLRANYQAVVEVYDVTGKVVWNELVLEDLKDTSIVEGLEPLFEVNINTAVDAMIEIPAGKLTAGERIFAYKFKNDPETGYINALIDVGRSAQTALYSTHLIPMGE